jgi:hypothetical protein
MTAPLSLRNDPLYHRRSFDEIADIIEERL